MSLIPDEVIEQVREAAVLVGIIAGVAPAVRAARLDPGIGLRLRT